MQRRLAFLLAFIPTVLSGCLLFSGRHWDETRRDSIEPINSTLHRNLPRDVQANDLGAILAAYGTETITGPPWDNAIEVADEFSERRLRWNGSPASMGVREHYGQLLGLFETLDRAELRIDRVYWHQPEEWGYPADVRLIARGIRPNGAPAVLDQYSRIWITQRGQEWQIGKEEVKKRELVTTEQPQFDVATTAAGIVDQHDPPETPTFRLIGGPRIASGVAVGDVNCDSFEDAVMLNVSRMRIHLNRADGTFIDATRQFEVDIDLDNAATGIVLFDADNDGDPDMWVSGIYGERFFLNQDCRRFVDATDGTGIASSRWSSMPVVADYDRDGDLDIYVVRMGDHEKSAPEPNWDARNGFADSLYRNEGGGRFTDVAKEAGIDEPGWGLAAAWADYNNDLHPDLYVGNEFGQNALYRNNGDGTFTDVATEAGVLDRGAAMGVAWGDYDNDGDLDAFVSNMHANARWVMFHPDFPAPVPWYFSWVPRSDIEAIIDDLTRGSTLLRNNGDGTFTDVSVEAGVRDAQWGWGTEFLDYNNDGHLDIYATNGFVTGPLAADV